MRKAFFDNAERKRLYKEARAFLKLRAARSRYVKDRRNEAAPAAPAPVPARKAAAASAPGHPDLVVLPSSSEPSGQPVAESL